MNEGISTATFSKASGAAISIDHQDLRAARHIRLLSSILDEPAETIAIAVRARLPVIAALASDESKAA